MRVSDYEKTYVCVGENPKNTIRMGYCGDVHTLEQWLDICFPNEDTRQYFEKDKVSHVLEYILVHKGKRLKTSKLNCNLIHNHLAI